MSECSQGVGNRQSKKKRRQVRIGAWAWIAAGLLVFSGCGGGDRPTRTPVPTFTPTPQGMAAAPGTSGGTPAPPTNTVVVAMPTATLTATPVPPTLTPTTAPTDTATPEPTATATLTPTVAPTDTPTPEAIPTPSFDFILEVAEKHPTTSLAQNVVRVFLFVADQEGFGLGGYSLRVLHNGAELPVDKVSSDGLPGLTRGEPSPYTRFTNMNVIFVEAQAGTWEVQLVDTNGTAVGPAAEFELDADEVTRELYVRYRAQ